MARAKRYPVKVNTNKMGPASRFFSQMLSGAIIGQPRAIKHIVKVMAFLDGGLVNPSEPLGVMIFAGPSGCGKTHTAKVLANIMFGPLKDYPYPLTIVQCSNFIERHQVATLIGSPPGYIDSQKMPLLHRFNIGKYHLISHFKKSIELSEDEKLKQQARETLGQIKACFRAMRDGTEWAQYKKERLPARDVLSKIFSSIPMLSIILFDEIEKAHPDVWNLLLGILGDGQLQLASGETTDFTHSLIILTTNTGSREMQKVIGINRIGFAAPQESDPQRLERAIHNEAKRALEKVFPPELMGRLGKKIITFGVLTRYDYERIFTQFADGIKQEVAEQEGIAVGYTRDFISFVINDGNSRQYGARILKDAIGEYIQTPLSFAIASGELQKGDKALFALEDNKPTLLRQRRGNRQRKEKVKQQKEGP